jgi:hypothetical protein
MDCFVISFLATTLSIILVCAAWAERKQKKGESSLCQQRRGIIATAASALGLFAGLPDCDSGHQKGGDLEKLPNISAHYARGCAAALMRPT